MNHPPGGLAGGCWPPGDPHSRHAGKENVIDIVNWLSPGHALFPVIEAGAPTRWVLRRPHGEMVAADLARLGIDSDLPPAASADGRQDPRQAALEEALARAGMGGPVSSTALPSSSGDRPAPSGPDDVLVVGTGRLAAALGHATRHDPLTVTFDAVAQQIEAAWQAARPTVICVEDGPPPPGWVRLDARLAAIGVRRVRISVEGAHAFVEPVAARTTDPSHRCVLARRVACNPWPDETRAYWAAGNRGRRGPDLVQDSDGSGPATHHVVRALAEHLDDEAAARTLRVVDLDDATTSRHTVLPIPDGTHWRDGHEQ